MYGIYRWYLFHYSRNYDHVLILQHFIFLGLILHFVRKRTPGSRELNGCCRRKITDAKNFICDCISIRMGLNRGANWFEKEC